MRTRSSLRRPPRVLIPDPIGALLLSGPPPAPFPPPVGARGRPFPPLGDRCERAEPAPEPDTEPANAPEDAPEEVAARAEKPPLAALT
jgi:hypothetical protein